MKDEVIDAEFIMDLRDFLERRGYSHIISLGIEPRELNDAQEPETNKENYWLEPVKPDDPRLGYPDIEHTIHGISETDIIEMASGEDEIQYMIKVPAIDYNDYLKKR